MAKKKYELADELLDDLLTDVNEDVDSSAIDLGAPESAPLNLAIPKNPVSSTEIDDDKTELTHNQQDVEEVSFSSVAPVATNNPLATAHSSKIAQDKINDLEKELEGLRKRNEELSAVAETFRDQVDELKTRAESSEFHLIEDRKQFEEEKKTLLQALNEKEFQAQGLQTKLDEMDLRLNKNINRIRVRERELENRLEIVKIEGAALLRSKDEMILDLKRQLDQIGFEIDNAKLRSQQTHAKLQKKEDVLLRTVKALRLALSLIENDEPQKLKKVD